MAPRFAALVLLAVVPAVTHAQKIDWVGEKVMLREDGMRPGKVVAGELVRVGTPLDANRGYVIKGVCGGLVEFANFGWVAKADVVRWRDAEAYCTAKIEAGPPAARWYGLRSLVRTDAGYPFDADGKVRPLSAGNQAATRDIAEAVRLDPGCVGWRRAYGLMLTCSGEHEATVREFGEAARLAPDDHGMYAFFAPLLAAGDWDRGRAAIERAIALEPLKATYYHVRGAMFVGRQQFDRALADFETALRIDPECAAALSHRGLVRGAVGGQVDQGLADVARAIALDSANPEFYRNRIELSGLKDDHRQIDQDLQRLAELIPSDPEFVRHRAFCLATCSDDAVRDGKLAVELARKAVRMAGKNMLPTFYATLAAAYAANGEYDQAVAAEEAAIKLQEAEKPGNADYLLELKFRLTLFRDKKPYRE